MILTLLRIYVYIYIVNISVHGNTPYLIWFGKQKAMVNISVNWLSTIN